MNGNDVWYLMRECCEAPFDGIEEHERNALRQQYLADHVDWPLMGDAADVEEVLWRLTNSFANLLTENVSYYSRFLFPPACEFSVPIQPGIFKAINGTEGIHLVSLSYQDENRVTGMKIMVSC